MSRLTWRDRIRRDRILLLATVPGVALLLVFHYLPWLGNIIAFKDYQPFLGIARQPVVRPGQLPRHHSTAIRRSSTR